MANTAPPVGNTLDINMEELLHVAPTTILDSPFGEDVNTPLSEAESKVLQTSIAKERRVRVPLFCIRTKSGQPQVICGTNRKKYAELEKLETVPVIVVKFNSMEEAKQFAIEDNAQRRQLSQNRVVHQGYLLWQSFETEKVKGVTPRRRASEASGVGETTLANFKYVMDSGFQDIIDGMLNSTVTVNAAYTAAKTRVDAADAPAVPTPAPVKLGRVEADLKSATKVIKDLGKLAENVEALAKSVGGCGTAEKKKLLKKFQKHKALFQSAKGEGAVDKIIDAQESVEIELV